MDKQLRLKPSRFAKGATSKVRPKNPDGMPQCRWCLGSVYPPRRTFCSKDCVHEYRIRTSGSYMRECAYLRDKGICALCGIDCKWIAREALKLDGKERVQFLADYNITSKRKIWRRKYGGGLFDVDHIIPVRDGGGQSGMENLRTLCIECHKDVTKRM